MSHKIYSFEEIINILRNSGGETYFIPHVNEFKNSNFIKKTINFSKIKGYTKYSEFLECDLLDEVEIIDNLIKGYRSNDNIPPIVLTKNNSIIDGYHRTSAMDFLNYEKVVCFIQI